MGEVELDKLVTRFRDVWSLSPHKAIKTAKLAQLFHVLHATNGRLDYPNVGSRIDVNQMHINTEMVNSPNDATLLPFNCEDLDVTLQQSASIIMRQPSECPTVLDEHSEVGIKNKVINSNFESAEQNVHNPVKDGSALNPVDLLNSDDESPRAFFNAPTMRRAPTIRTHRSAPVDTAAVKIALLNHSNEVVVDKFNIDMTYKKFSCLREGVWLNDEVINFYMCMLQERDDELCSGPSSRQPSCYFNSFFMAKLFCDLNAYNFNIVKRWTWKRKIDVFHMNKVFVPINIRNGHWVMAVIFIQKKEIHHYDSMGNNGMLYLNHLLHWLKDEAADKTNQDLDTTLWRLHHQGKEVPRQDNYDDCGVFSIMCADVVSDDLPVNERTYNFSQMPTIRLQIGAAIMQGRISY